MIRVLKIQNFMQFKSAEIFFGDNLTNKTLICGVGGSGKTSIQKALQWGMKRESEEFLRKNITNVESIKNANIGEKIETSVEIEIEVKGEIYKSIKKLYVVCSASGETVKEKTTFEVYKKENNEWKCLRNDKLIKSKYMELMFLQEEGFLGKKFIENKIHEIDVQIPKMIKARRICERAEKRFKNMMSTDFQFLKGQLHVLDSAIKERKLLLESINAELVVVQEEVNLYKRHLMEEKQFAQKMV